MASPYTQDQVSAYVGELQKLVDSGQITQDVANRTIANELRYLPSGEAATAATGQIAEAFPGLSQQDVMNVYNQIVAPEVLAGVAGVSGALKETSPELFETFAENYAAAMAPPADSGTGGITDLPLAPSGGNNIDLTGGGSSVTVGGGDGVTTGIGVSGNGITLGAGGTNIDLTGGGGSSVTLGGGDGVTIPVSAPPPAPQYTLTQTEQDFLAGLPENLQPIYREYATKLGQGSTAGQTLDYLTDQGYDIADILRASGAGQFFEQPSAPTSTDLTPGGMQQFSYTDFPGGIYGPGQQMPNIFVPANQQQPAAQAPAAPTAAPGPRTAVSPGITTYAYPQPFGEIDIFGRPTATPPTAYTPPATTDS